MCRELKGKQSLVKVLKKAQDATMDVYGRSGDEDDLRELLDAPNIIGNYFYTPSNLNINENFVTSLTRFLHSSVEIPTEPDPPGLWPTWSRRSFPLPRSRSYFFGQKTLDRPEVDPTSAGSRRRRIWVQRARRCARNHSCGRSQFSS